MLRDTPCPWRCAEGYYRHLAEPGETKTGWAHNPEVAGSNPAPATSRFRARLAQLRDLGGRPRGGGDLVARRDQPGNEVPSQCPGRSRDEDSHDHSPSAWCFPLKDKAPASLRRHQRARHRPPGRHRSQVCAFHIGQARRPSSRATRGRLGRKQPAGADDDGLRCRRLPSIRARSG